MCKAIRSLSHLSGKLVFGRNKHLVFARKVLLDDMRHKDTSWMWAGVFQ